MSDKLPVIDVTKTVPYTEGFIAGFNQAIDEFEQRFCDPEFKPAGYKDAMWIKNIELFIKDRRKNVGKK